MKLTIEANEGVEAQEIRLMLLKMYFNFCCQKKIGAKWIVQSPVGPGAPERETKTLGLSIDSNELGGEHGLHRVCRISPYDPKLRRHTTFCYVVIDDQESSSEVVRSYVFNPYQKVKNYKDDRQTTDINGVFNGNLDFLL